MNFHWARSNKPLLIILVIAVAIVSVLTTLVMYQQHDQSMVDGQVPLRTAPTVSAPGVPVADMMAIPNAAALSTPATTPDPANAPVGPASPPAPGSPAPQVATAPITPALGVPAAGSSTSPPSAPSSRAPRKPKKLPHRRVNSVPAPPPAAVAPPVISAPQTDPVTPTSSAKPGSPDGW
jgi:hypothetical protein